MRKDEDRLLKILSIIFTLATIVGIIYGIYKRNITLIIVFTLFFLFCGFAFYVLILMGYLDKFNTNKNLKFKQYLSSKENLSGYEQLIYDVISDKTAYILSERIGNKKNKKLYSMKFEYRNKKIIFKFSYCDFYIYCKIFTSYIKIKIYKPEKFKYGNVKETLNFKRCTYSDLQNMNTDDIYLYLEELIKEIVVDIKNYININKNNNSINFRRFYNLDYHMKTHMVYSITYIICGLFFSFLSAIFTYQCIIKNVSFTTEYVLGAWIFSLSLTIIGLILSGVGIKIFKQYIAFSKDKKEQIVETVEGPCVKIKFFADGLGRHTRKRIFRRITFTINVNSKIVKIYLKVDKIYEPSTIDWHNLKKQLINKVCKFKYLKNSKMIISCDQKVSTYIKDL